MRYSREKARPFISATVTRIEKKRDTKAILTSGLKRNGSIGSYCLEEENFGSKYFLGLKFPDLEAQEWAQNSTQRDLNQ